MIKRDDGERSTKGGEQAGRSLSTGLNGWLETIRASGKTPAELAREYRLPEDYITSALAAGPEEEDEEGEVSARAEA